MSLKAIFTKLSCRTESHKNHLHVVCSDSDGEMQNADFASNNPKLMMREVESTEDVSQNDISGSFSDFHSSLLNVGGMW